MMSDLPQRRLAKSVLSRTQQLITCSILSNSDKNNSEMMGIPLHLPSHQSCPFKVVRSLHNISCVMCIEMLAASHRRGIPSVFRSDNRTNFMLQMFVTKRVRLESRDSPVKNQIHWKFNRLGASHRGTSGN